MPSRLAEHKPDSDPSRKLIEVDFALVLSRMINSVKADPSQLRSVVYELARTKLQETFREGDIHEAQAMASALEIAIKGVEQFSRRQEEVLPAARNERSVDAHRSDFNDQGSPRLGITADFIENVEPVGTSSDERSRFKTIVMLSYLVVAVAGICAISYGSLSRLSIFSVFRNPPTAATKPALASKSVGSALPSEFATQAVLGQKAGSYASGSPMSGLPLPTVYGIYAVSNGVLSELNALPGRVPDRRVAISSTVESPSRTILSDGRISFILFRRELATSAPERLEVRVIAKISRALSFDKAGRARAEPVDDIWTIRNIYHDFRVAPLPENSEMLIARSDTADLVLPAGRYGLVIKGQAYDFTIGGYVSDASQCLERVEAANGSFYAECKTPALLK
jgi:hypothetical protein